jgi:tRNA(fMet)-specific endonuclease VapC
VGVLIDASVLIEQERGRIELSRRLAGREEEEFFLSVITASELLHGAHRAADAGVRARRSAFVEAVLNQFPLLPIDLGTARIHAQLWAELAARGEMIGAHDLWLGAACIANGLSIATGNPREFRRVPGLTVESWIEG